MAIPNRLVCVVAALLMLLPVVPVGSAYWSHHCVTPDLVDDPYDSSTGSGAQEILCVDVLYEPLYGGPWGIAIVFDHALQMNGIAEMRYEINFTPTFGLFEDIPQVVQIRYDGTSQPRASFGTRDLDGAFVPTPGRSVGTTWSGDFIEVFWTEDQFGTAKHGDQFLDVQVVAMHCTASGPLACAPAIDDIAPATPYDFTFLRPVSNGLEVSISWDAYDDHVEPPCATPPCAPYGRAADLERIGVGDVDDHVYLYVTMQELQDHQRDVRLRIDFCTTIGLRLEGTITGPRAATFDQLYRNESGTYTPIAASVGVSVQGDTIRYDLPRFAAGNPQDGDSIACAWGHALSTDPVPVTIDRSSPSAYYVVGGGGWDMSEPWPPENVVATQTAPGEVTITWDPAVDDQGIMSYAVVRDTGNGCRGYWDGTCEWLGETLTTSYVDTTAWSGASYKYQVIAMDTGYNVGDASAASAITIGAGPSDATPPPAFTITATDLDTHRVIRLAWPTVGDPESGVPYVTVHVGTSPGVVPSDANRLWGAFMATSGSLEIDGLVHGQTYYFVMKATNRAGLTTQSPEASATAIQDTTPPGPPQNVVGSSNRNGNVHLDWQHATGDAIQSYKFYYYYYSDQSGSLATRLLYGTATSLDHYGFRNEEPHCVWLTAIDDVGLESAPSPTVCVTPRSSLALHTASLDHTVTEGQLLGMDVSWTNPYGDRPEIVVQSGPTGVTWDYDYYGEGYPNYWTYGRLNWTPTLDQQGDHQIVLFAEDTWKGGTATITINVTVLNVDRPVTLDPIPDKQVYETATLAFDVRSVDPDGPATLQLVSGPSGASLLDRGDGTGRFAWTPGAGTAGTHPVTIRATEAGVSVERSFNVNVRFSAGLGLDLEGAPTREASPGEVVVFRATVTNTGPNSDTFGFSATQSGTWSIASPADVTLGPGATATVEWRVTVPSNGVVDAITLRAFSRADAAVARTISTQVRVPVAGVLALDTRTPGPGDPITGTITARHLDGTPAVGAVVTITQTPDFGGANFATTITGVTNATGVFAFDLGSDARGRLAGGHDVLASARKAGGFAVEMRDRYVVG